MTDVRQSRDCELRWKNTLVFLEHSSIHLELREAASCDRVRSELCSESRDEVTRSREEELR